MNDRKPIIELKNVSVCYGQGKTNEIHALKEIDLNIYEGEYIVFFGPSGCGKSTLLYTIAGLERATAGSVIVNNKNIREFDTEEMIDFYRTTIGMVFQAFYLVLKQIPQAILLILGPLEPKKSDGFQRRNQGIGTAIDGDAARNTAISRESILETNHLLAQDVSTAVEHAGNGREDRIPLRLELRERQRAGNHVPTSTLGT